MKIVKLLLVFALVSTIAVSCKETKKETVQDDAVEMTEEGSDSGMEAADDAAASESTEEGSSHDAAAGAAAAGAATTADDEGSMEAVEAVEGETKELEPVVVPEGVIAEELADTPVIYPGCTGSTAEEIRACNKESFIAYVKSEFKHDNVANDARIKKGDYAIGVVMHVNKAGRVFSFRVTAPNETLENEMVRVVNSTPKVVPATVDGQPVGVSLKFNVDFRIEATQ